MSKEIILKEINPRSVGAPPRFVIGEDSNNHLYIIKNINKPIGTAKSIPSTLSKTPP